MGVVHVGTGAVTGEEILQGSETVAQLVQNTENFHYELVDLSAATEVTISAEQLEAIAEQDRLAAFFRPNAVVVIIAPNDEVFALVKQWEEMVRPLGWKTFVSQDRVAALRWLRQNFPTKPDAPAAAPKEETA